MFTGIVTEVGTIRAVTAGARSARIVVETVRVAGEVVLGDSVAVNGACLTVAEMDPPALTFDVVTETLRKTTLSDLARGRKVNLEPALRVGDRLSGHFVMGHVDGVGEIVSRSDDPGQVTVRIRAPEALDGLLVEKGSVAVEGVSLTTWDVEGREFSLALVPHTLSATTLPTLSRGAKVNLEADIIARWVAKLLPRSDGGGLTFETLRDAGWDV